MIGLGSATVLRGDARHLPLPDNSVDLVVTSPPYFALRSYQDGGEHYGGQIGSEATPTEFVAALLDVTRECVRVLKPSGSLWVNLGDKYAGSQPAASRWHTATLDGGRGRLPEWAESQSTVADTEWGTVRPKSLIGIPWRYALRCIDDLGLILRAEVIWSKPNGLPESVTDRVRRSHEQWFHFTREPRYFSAVDEIREAHVSSTPGRGGLNKRGAESYHALGGAGSTGKWSGDVSPLGKLPGSVWTIPTEPLRVPDHLGVDHFAAFPTEWPKRIIQGWSPAGVCVQCGEGRRPVTDTRELEQKPFAGRQALDPGHNWTQGGNEKRGLGYAAHERERQITGYACACDPKVCRVCDLPSVPYCEGFRCCDSCTHGTDAPTTPAVVLDPFGGTGTTAMVAKALGRHGITVDMSADYCRLAEWRTNDRNQLAKVLDIPKIKQQDHDQLDLLALMEGD